MKFYYMLIIIAPCVQQNGGTAWNSQLDERIIPFTVPYLQEIWTATAGEIFVVFVRLAMFCIVIQWT